MVNFRKKESFSCRYGTYTKIKETKHSIAWRLEEVGGTIAYEVWDKDHNGARIPQHNSYGRTAFYSRKESDVDFWIRHIEKRSGE